MKKLILLFFILFSTNEIFRKKSSYADETKITTDEKEKIALEIFSETNNLSDSYGRFIVVRDHNLYGMNGISKKFTTCQADLKRWIKSWEDFVKNIQLNHSKEIYPFSTTLQDFFSIQSLQAEKIKINCNYVIENANKSLEIMKNSVPYSKVILSEYNYYLGEIEKYTKRIYTVLEKYILDTKYYLKKLEELNIKSHKSVFSKITIEIYKLKPEDPIIILNDFYSLINASRDLNPSVAKINMTEKKIQEYIEKYKYFKALKLYDHILLDCAKTHREILNNIINTKYLSYKFDKMRESCSNTYNAFMRFKKKFKNKHDYIINFIEYTKNNTKIDCSNNVNIIPCNEFSVIKSIKIDELKNFSEQKLSFIESKLDTILEEYKL